MSWVGLWLQVAHASEPIPHHCAPGEAVVMSCAMEDSTKVLSLCASPGATAEQGYLQYRFGKRGSVELEYPTDRSVPPGRAFEYTSMLNPPGGSSSYNFSIKGHTYSVFSFSHAGDESSGVRVDSKELLCGPALWGKGPPLPNQAILEIKAAARNVLASCGEKIPEHGKQTVEEALAMKDTDALHVSLLDVDLLQELKAMTCP
jgi:hypothetical protein